MLKDLIQDHPEFEACVSLLASESALAHLTGYMYYNLIFIVIIIY